MTAMRTAPDGERQAEALGAEVPVVSLPGVGRVSPRGIAFLVFGSA